MDGSSTSLRAAARQIFDEALMAVDPREAVLRYVRRDGDRLVVDGKPYDLSHYRNIHIVGTGKAGAAMSAGLEHVLGDRITTGFVNVKDDHVVPLKKTLLIEAGHPIPDQRGMDGAERMVRLLDTLGEDDLVFCVISGGGSALLPLPVEGVSLAEKQEATQQLLACGAAIQEINTLRKHISRVKGGQLARHAYPATVITLILSDVIGDPLDVIASGPTVPDPGTFDDCLAILSRYQLEASFPASVTRHLREGLEGQRPETPKPGDPVFSRVQNVLVASNFQALQAAAMTARRLGFNTLILSSSMDGETREIARIYPALAREIRATGNPVAAPACIVSGGETTVTLKGNGRGGRNQEFVLSACRGLDGMRRVVVFSAGTDGTDGPTDAAGAVADGATLQRAGKGKLRVEDFLSRNDAYTFFQRLDDLIITGPTNTNVMDLRLLLVDVE